MEKLCYQNPVSGIINLYYQKIGLQKCFNELLNNIEKKDQVKEKELESKITMQDRKKNPVIKITPTKEKLADIKIATKRDTIKEPVSEEEHRLQHLVSNLRDNNINFNIIGKMPTGLYEMYVYQLNDNPILISVDINGLLYCDEVKFFIGKINPGEEYVKPCIIMTNTVLDNIVKGMQIDKKYYINESLHTLNKILDIQTLKEKDPKKRSKVLEMAAKALSEKDIYDAILKTSNGEPYRFAFARYKSDKEFSLVSSKKNLASNLDNNSKLITTKEMWVNVKDKEIKFTQKK